MKTFLLVIMLFLQTVFAFAQRQESASKEIKDAIAKEFNQWLEKGEFETTAEYESRIKKADEKLQAITNEVTLSTKTKYLKRNLAGVLGEYNADDETYLIEVNSADAYSAAVDPQKLVIKVPPKIASILTTRIGKVRSYLFTYGGIKIIPNDVAIINDKWILTDALIIFYLNHRYDSDADTRKIIVQKKSDKVFCKTIYDNEMFKAMDLKQCTNDSKLPDGTRTNSSAGPRGDYCYYDWKLSEQPNYNPSNVKPISFSLEDLNIILPTISTNTQTVNSITEQVPDLDMNRIQTKNKNSNAFAIVIGNKDYQYTKKVSFAINDAQTIKRYLINVLGYNEGNIFYLENASKSNFETYFGTKENPQGKLYNNIKQGISDVFIYYSGHGAPGLKDNKGYFVPIDCDPQYVEQGGYSLDLFYNNISKLNAKSITVITDACFSGAEIFNNISPIVITVSNPIAVADNCVVLTSSTGSQVSTWYNDKQHGMFTYFFLKALEDKDKSDKNKDGKLSFQEIFDYVSDKTEGVPYYARSIHGVDQTPAIQGTGVENIFIEYK